MDDSSQEALENRIARIYRTYYANFGSTPVPESAELAALWGAWEELEAERENV